MGFPDSTKWWEMCMIMRKFIVKECFMSVEEMWDYLLRLGTSEETLQTVTAINGYNTESMEDILYAQYGYRSFDQLEE